MKKGPKTLAHFAQKKLFLGSFLRWGFLGFPGFGGRFFRPSFFGFSFHFFLFHTNPWLNTKTFF